MNRTTQTQSQRSTNLKLSAAQIALLTQIEHRFMSQMEVATLRVAEAKRAAKLETMGLLKIIYADFFYVTYEITSEGRAAIGVETVEEKPAASSEDELPAKMPMPALMDEDTAPVMPVVNRTREPLPRVRAYRKENAAEIMETTKRYLESNQPEAPVMEETPAQEPAIGDSVRYIYNTDNTVKQVFSGEIVDIKHSTVLNSIMYRVQPDADERLAYLGAVWIMPYQLEGQAHLDPVCDQLATLRKIEAAYLKWEAAYLAGRFEEAARLDMIHRKLEDEHRERLYGPRRPCPKNAPQSPQNGPNGDIEAIQAWMKVMGTETPPIAPATPRHKGTLSYWNAQKGYGYIACDGFSDNIRVARAALVGMRTNGNLTIERGANVEFSLSATGSALNVVLTDIAHAVEAYAAQQTQRPATPVVTRRGARSGLQQGQATFKTNPEELANARAIVDRIRNAN